MINKISSKIAEILIRHSAIEYEDKELYSYGFFILLSQILYFIITITTGILFNIIIESIIFYIAFMLIRRYAGGYHASTETRCEILSTLSILGCIVVIWLSKTYDFQTVLLIISAISAVCIFAFCPLDTPEKPLSDKEFRYFRKISWAILLVIVTLTVISYIFKWNFVFAPCCMSLVLESILISAEKIKRLLDNKKTKI